MKPQDFVNSFYGFALEVQKLKGISAEAILTQAAIESAWGEHAPGNMFFGVKDTDGLNGNEQLIRTKEILRSANHKFPVIHSITPITIDGLKYFKYDCEDYFRKYATPKDSFEDHANFFFENKIYNDALKVRDNAEKFLIEIARAGYATATNYKDVCLSVLKIIQKYLPINGFIN